MKTITPETLLHTLPPPPAPPPRPVRRRPSSLVEFILKRVRTSAAAFQPLGCLPHSRVRQVACSSIIGLEDFGNLLLLSL